MHGNSKYDVVCKYCDKKLSYKNHLTRHLKICKVKKEQDNQILIKQKEELDNKKGYCNTRAY